MSIATGIRALTLTLLTMLGGCSSIAKAYIEHRPRHDLKAMAEVAAKLGFEKHRFCSPHADTCISYLTGVPTLEDAEFSYEVEVTAGGQKEIIALHMTRAQVPTEVHGTVLLLHGFRGSKEFMINDALYFRFLGLHVILPDLLGHGENHDPVQFGPKDSEALTELLDQAGELQGPLYVFGYSMGALAAAHLERRRTDVAGLILQAPMMTFDRSVLGYAKQYSPVLYRLLTPRSIQAGARKALASAKTPLEQTDIKPLLAASCTPTLIIASSNDPVAPHDYFEDLSKGTLAVVSPAHRGHLAMGAIIAADSDWILPWLRANPGPASNHSACAAAAIDAH